MKATKPNHWLLDMVSQEEYDRAFKFADTYFVYSSLQDCFVVEDNWEENNSQEKEKLVEIIDLLELVAVDLQASSGDNIKSEKANDLFKVCHDLYFLIRIFPVPQDEIEKIKYIYKLISYAYLGQKWESGRRFLIENKDLCSVTISTTESWDLRLFKKIYLAFFYLIRKNDWHDLDKASQYITDLRKEQAQFEKVYLESLDPEYIKSGAYELLGLYHFAKAIDLMAQFMINGSLSDIRQRIDFHFDKAIEAADQSMNVEMSLILNMLLYAIKQMLANSIWMVTERVNSRVTKFVNDITKSSRPVYELLYPQKLAILEKGLLDPAHKAVVVNMPTSSGKTLLAEFRILQGLNQFADDKGWVVYVAPTRALVNQVTTSLKRDLSPVGIQVEKMSGAIELDSFEQSLLDKESKRFDVLVTTPEKLNFLIRDNIEDKIGRPLALAVIDEAHNIEDKNRGISLELLMANIKSDCPKSNFLLLTPFIPNSYQVAKWLDPDSPNAISIELSWTPNDRIIGAIYPEGNRRNWKTYFETLLTSNERIQIEKKILINNNTPIDVTRSRLTKTKLAMAVSKQLIQRKGILGICFTVDNCWQFAKDLYEELDECGYDEDIELVKRFIAAELGEEFVLISLLDKRIGVHHSGLPDEVKYLMEWLMEKSKLKVLVATTTIAQGINFPVSTILMASYAYPYMSNMPVRDFWNLVGRSGRQDQGTLGVVGIVLGEKPAEKEAELTKLKQFVSKSTERLVSHMVTMVDDVIKLGNELDLASLFWKPEWSQFMQYITHMYNQCKDLGEFNTKVEIFLRRTFGYNLIDIQKRKTIVEAVRKYGEKLDRNKGLAMLSDSTGFSMEAITQTLSKAKKLGLNSKSLSESNLFSNNADLKNIMGLMLSIPEIKANLKDLVIGGESITGNMLARLTTDWVSGKGIDILAREYFSGSEESAITECCRAIYSKLTNSATWGLASLQKLSGLDIDNMSEEEKKRINNLPAMIYYGVNSDEAILMRINNIPRSIASVMGEKYKAKHKNIYSSTASQVSSWLSNLKDNEWNDAVKNKQIISGKEYKRIWGILNGEE